MLLYNVELKPCDVLQVGLENGRAVVLYLFCMYDYVEITSLHSTINDPLFYLYVNIQIVEIDISNSYCDSLLTQKIL